MAAEKAKEAGCVVEVEKALGCTNTSAEQTEWMVDVEESLCNTNFSLEDELWQKRSVYRVPACIKDLNPKAYQPQVVSLGPFHHGDAYLLLMEEHKCRALRHMLKRVGKPLRDFFTALEEVAQTLEDAYLDLGDEWRGKNRKRFLKVMITDGCFLLEVMRRSSSSELNDYGPSDPIFSKHGILYNVPYIQRDMLMIENQLPLLVLERLLAVMNGSMNEKDKINSMVLRFLSPKSNAPAPGTRLGLHPLDVFHRSLLIVPWHSHRMPSEKPKTDIIRSAVELSEAGIRFRKSQTKSLRDIRFRSACGILSLPEIVVDDSTEYMFLNLMAFERLHIGAGNDVTAYVFLMDNIIDSAKDVSLLSSKGIIQSAVGSDKEVAKLFNRLSKDVVLDQESPLAVVHELVGDYSGKKWNTWRANLSHTYFRSPWALLSLLAAAFLLGMTVVQTVYSVKSYNPQNSNSFPSPPSARARP